MSDEVKEMMEYRNPIFVNASGTRIDMEINHPKFGWIPFTADKDDIEAHGRELWADAVPHAAVFVPKPFNRESMTPLFPRQLRLGLVRNGISLTQVDDAIAAMPDGPAKDEAKIEWEYATSFNRTHSLLELIGAGFGLSPEQIDEMWREALTI
jgi:hypothetical protein